MKKGKKKKPDKTSGLIFKVPTNADIKVINVSAEDLPKGLLNTKKKKPDKTSGLIFSNPSGVKLNLELGTLEIPASSIKTNKLNINISKFSDEDIGPLSQKINQLFHQEEE